MRRIIQLILFLFIILIAFIFYTTYLNEDKKSELTSLENKNDLPISNKNNLVKNLKYDVKFEEDKKYTISSNLSEITYENNVEIVKMQKVTAIFLDETNIPLTVLADKATFNNSNYNTTFSENVIIRYIDNIVISNKMDLNFEDSSILIYENVEYEGLQGSIKADNVKINLITKKIEIYMNNNKEKVEVTTKK